MAKAIPLDKLTLPDDLLRHSAPATLVRLTEMLEFAPAIHDPGNITELHDMRIAAKRLRYTLEIFGPVLGKKARKIIKAVTEIQERLGVIHDADILMDLLTVTLKQEQKREKKKVFKKHKEMPAHFAAEGLVALLAKKREERDQKYHEFVAFWDALPPETFAASVARLVQLPEQDESEKKSSS